MASIDSARVDRRTLIVGGASVAAGAVLLKAPQAQATSVETAWTPALVAGRVTDDAVDVTSLDTHRRVRVGLSPDTIVHADLEVGSQVLIEGDDSADGAVAARRVIRGVFGERSDVRR